MNTDGATALPLIDSPPRATGRRSRAGALASRAARGKEQPSAIAPGPRIHGTPSPFGKRAAYYAACPRLTRADSKSGRVCSHRPPHESGFPDRRRPLDVFVELDDAERFIEEVRGDDPDLARLLWINEREMIHPSRLSS